MLGLWELTDGVLTQTALDVCVGMAQLTAIWAFQGNLSDTGPLLLAARTPVIQILGLGRVHGKSPTGPITVVHGDVLGAAIVGNLLHDGDGRARNSGLVRNACPTAAIRHVCDGAWNTITWVEVRAGDIGD